MGLFRFFLALTILIGHEHEGKYIPASIFPYVQATGYYGAAKIHCFFLISGFFSDMLLNERLEKSANYVKDFYVTRLMRLLPNYYLMLALTYWFVIAAPSYGFTPVHAKTINVHFFYNKFHQDGWLYILANLFAFVPETVRIYGFDHAQGVLYLLVTQAWPLSIEYLCLLMAPALLRNNKLYVFAIGFFAIAAIVLALHGIYRNYVLTTVIFYLCGSLAYRAYRRWLLHQKATNLLKVIIILLLALLISCLFYFDFIAGMIGLSVTYWIFMVIAFASLPFLFLGSKSFLRDRWIGDLAYPIYLNHALMLMLFWSYKFNPANAWWLIPAASIFFAILMLEGIDKPLQRLRKQIYYR